VSRTVTTDASDLGGKLAISAAHWRACKQQRVVNELARGHTLHIDVSITNPCALHVKGAYSRQTSRTMLQLMPVLPCQSLNLLEHFSITAPQQLAVPAGDLAVFVSAVFPSCSNCRKSNASRMPTSSQPNVLTSAPV
jgi:hypothetical protein